MHPLYSLAPLTKVLSKQGKQVQKQFHHKILEMDHLKQPVSS